MAYRFDVGGYDGENGTRQTGYYDVDTGEFAADQGAAAQQAQIDLDNSLPDLSHLSPHQQYQVAVQLGLDSGQLSRMATTGKIAPGGAIGELIASQQNTRDGLGGFVKGVGIHAQNILDTYRNNPEMLLTAGIAGPVGSSAEGDLWNKEGQDASNIWGQPSDSSYQQMSNEGIATGGSSLTRGFHTAGQLVGGTAATMGLMNAAGLGASAAPADGGGNPAYFDGATASNAPVTDVPIQNVYGPPDLGAYTPAAYDAAAAAEGAAGFGAAGTAAPAAPVAGAGLTAEQIAAGAGATTAATGVANSGDGGSGTDTKITPPDTDYGGDVPAGPVEIPDGSIFDGMDAASLEQLFQQYPNLIRSGGAIGSSILGYMGAREQRDELRRLADRQFQIGQPSRDRYEATFAPGFSLANDQAFMNTMDTTMNSTLRGLSTQGNPFDNPGGLMEAQKYVMGTVGLPYLNEYRRLNAGSGGLANLTSSAPSTAAAGINAGGGMYNAIGYGIGQMTNPQPTIADLLRQYQGSSGGLA